MPIIGVRDNENNRWERNAKKKNPATTTKNQTKKEKSKAEREGGWSYSERVRAKLFCCVFKLGFLQLIYKASLIFKSNLELALSIILKKRELCAKTCCSGV